MTAAVVSALGVETGTLLHVAAAVGLPALPASSASTLDMVRHLGAAYLAFLGLQRLLGRDEEPGLVARRGLCGYDGATCRVSSRTRCTRK